jgi:hypothetical protein
MFDPPDWYLLMRPGRAPACRRTRRFDRLLDASDPVSWKIGYDDDVAALEDRDNALCDMREKYQPVDRALKHEWRDEAAHQLYLPIVFARPQPNRADLQQIQGAFTQGR